MWETMRQILTTSETLCADNYSRLSGLPRPASAELGDRAGASS